MDVLLGIVLVLGIMILVHELGHFFMARFFDVRVDVFSIGFGPRLFGWKRGATDYRVSLLPLGGYVRMAGQDLGEDRTGAPDELVSKPRWQRALIAFAGPAVNLILPVLLFAGFFIGKGVPYSAYLDRPVQVTALPAGAPADATPLHVGDRVISLNGKQNPTWEEALMELSQLAPNGAAKLEVESGGKLRTVELIVKDSDQVQKLLGYPPVPAIVDEVIAGMPAYRAGLRPDDRIIEVNGQKVEVWNQFVDAVKHSNGQQLSLAVNRKGQVFRMELTPQQGANERGETVWQVGILVRDETAYRRVSFLDGCKYSAVLTVSKIDEVLGVVGRLLSGRVSIRQLQGVVGIARESGQAVRKGPSSVILLMAIISLNLGILNLLPIPILDGGHILLLAIEGAIRRDLSMAFKERFIQVGFVFLLVLFGFVMYNDVVRMLPTH